jgi:hypothetical protein
MLKQVVYIVLSNFDVHSAWGRVSSAQRAAMLAAFAGSSRRTRDIVKSILRSTMSRTKRRASKWLVPGWAEVMVALVEIAQMPVA